jgi:hypothetical protein
MKPALRKLHDRLNVVGDAHKPVKPTIVAFRYTEGLLFENRIFPDFEAIHAAYPGKYDRNPIGVELTVMDGRTGLDATQSWVEVNA